MATITATATGGTRAWSDTATWDTVTVPTAADDVVLDAASGAVTIAAAAVARSLNASAYTGTLTHNAAVTLTLGDATAGTGNAALTLGSGMTYTLGNASTSAITLVSTSTTQQTITTAGKTLGNITFNATAGTWILTDTMTSSAFLISAGTVNLGGQTLTCLTFAINGATAFATIGTATINLTSTAATNIFLRTGGGNFSAGAATVNIVTASTNTRSFVPSSANLAQGTLNYTVAGSTGGLTVLGALSLAALNFSDASNARTLTFPSGTTFPIASFNVVGSPAGLMSVVSSTSGSAATLSKSSRVVSVDYLSIKDITATGGASWYAGANSTNVSGNTGWNFTPPSNYQFLQFA